MNHYSLLRGCSLFPLTPTGYAFGTLSHVVTVTSAYQRTALTQLAMGVDPLAQVNLSLHEHLNDFLIELHSNGLLNNRISEISTPARSMSEISTNDIAINQLRARSAPELAQSEWIDQQGDGGVSIVAARAHHPIVLSGRSRVISILYSILLASGVSQVRFADRHWRPTIGNLDIGFGAITAADLGGNYYDVLYSRRRELSLFPIDKKLEHGTDNSKPTLLIHYGESDPEQLIEWSQKRIPHVVIHPPIGDEIVIGPLVIAGESPCNRCLSLYERDNFGFTTSEKIPLTALEDLPTVAAHYVAAILASQILHFIDQSHSAEGKRTSRNTGVGEITYINFQRLTEPQVVAIARHPLCGCDR
jgi:hypothetical protein